MALYDGGYNEQKNAWRCYSPTCLDSTGTKYMNASHCREYCTTSALAEILQNCTDPVKPPTGRAIRVEPTDVWRNLATWCGQIRTPELTITPSRILLIGQCRNGNVTRNGHDSESFGDDMRPDRLVLIASTDGGQTWDPDSIQVISDRGCSVGVAQYDALRKQVILQYQAFTLSDPYHGNTLYQQISSDDGATWSWPRNITSVLAQCNSGPGGQVCGAAGSRLQTVSGRVVFAGHNAAGVCVWYSDDSGDTWKTTAGPEGHLLTGNEVSIADLGNGSLYMNGRGTSFPFAGHRASYWSHDDGATWTDGVEARNLVEPNSFGCDGAVIAVPPQHTSTPPRLFFSEPAGPGSRISLRVWCSRDSGMTWDRYTEINTGNAAGYSAMVQVENTTSGNPDLLVVWEDRPTMLSYRLSIDWCPEL